MNSFRFDSLYELIVMVIVMRCICIDDNKFYITNPIKADEKANIGTGYSAHVSQHLVHLLVAIVKVNGVV